MKKFAITLCILGLTSGAFASMQSETMADAPRIRAEGYSLEMTKVTDLVKYQHSNGQAEPYYAVNKDPYSGSETEAGKWYSVAKRFLDPAQDDNLFGRHEIPFSNSWFDDSLPVAGKNKGVYAGDNTEAAPAAEPVETNPLDVDSL